MTGSRTPPLANPWLAGEAPTAALPRDELEERILSLLLSQNMAVVSTCGADDDLLDVYRRQSDALERERSLSEPPKGPLVAVDATRVVHTEHYLRRRGFAPRQFWRASAGLS